jgi:hypothetical protein
VWGYLLILYLPISFPRDLHLQVEGETRNPSTLVFLIIADILKVLVSVVALTLEWASAPDGGLAKQIAGPHSQCF